MPHNYKDRDRFGVAYKDDPKEWRRRYAAQYRLDHPLKHLLQMAKGRAKASGMEFDIGEDDLVIPEFCPIFPEIRLVGPDGSKENAGYSLDRVDNTKGYVKGNVRVISRLANLKKDNWTLDKLERLVSYIKGEI